MSTTEPVRVMVVDDHPIMRNGLRDALGDEPDFEVVAVAADGVEAVQTAQRVEPDVVVMDVMMPEKGGVDACREIMDLLPDTKVLMLTASTRETPWWSRWPRGRRATCRRTRQRRSLPRPFGRLRRAASACRMR